MKTTKTELQTLENIGAEKLKVLKRIAVKYGIPPEYYLLKLNREDEKEKNLYSLFVEKKDLDNFIARGGFIRFSEDNHGNAFRVFSIVLHNFLIRGDNVISVSDFDLSFCIEHRAKFMEDYEVYRDCGILFIRRMKKLHDNMVEFLSDRASKGSLTIIHESSALKASNTMNPVFRKEFNKPLLKY